MINDDREWLESGDGLPLRVRPEIGTSWRRSQLNGADPDTVQIVPGEARLDSKIARAAIPVLRATADVMIGANTSLLLSDPDGTILWRWEEDSRLTSLLDRSSAVVGTRWSEDVIGTNGLGTALETIQPITVHGTEHFSEALHDFTCAGAPIRHPITRRIAGTLSVTSLSKDESPLMAATLKKLVREVEEQLFGDSTVRERELLHHYLTERRRSDRPLVVLDGETVIANKAGAKLGIDARALWNQIEAGRPEAAGVELSSVQGANDVSWRTIEHAGSVVGLVITGDQPRREDRKAPRRSSPAVGIPRWFELPHRLRRGAQGVDRLLVVGEAGVGKRALVRETFGDQYSVSELDCSEAGELGSKHWLATARRIVDELSNGCHDDRRTVLLLSHMDTLTSGLCRSLGRILDDVPRSDDVLKIVGTWTPTGADPTPLVQSLLDRFSADPFEVPPLRKRPADIEARLVAQGPTVPVLSRAALELAKKHPWPGNHRQLEEFRRWLGRQSVPAIDVGDLPPRWSRDAARAGLTAIQAAEADAISAALSAHDGNKAAAAAELGISRSSLYRKMREYHLT